MKERPIIFSAPMIRAILDGSKTQTRRIVKGAQADWTPVAPRVYWPLVVDRHGEERPGSVTYGAGNEDGSDWFPCPYGKPGDRLWVRETWAPHFMYEGVRPADIPIDDQSCLFYMADGAITGGCLDSQRAKRWRPAIHMPRKASRIDLAITGVRLERLQDISRGDAMAEGCPFANMASGPDPRQWYAGLWDQINGAGSWEANPWVWCLEFKRVTP